MPLLQKKPHRFRLCLVSLRTSLVFLDLAINSFLSRTILVSDIPFRSVSFPFVSAVSTLYSPRYPQCLPYNIVDTLSNPSFVLPTFSHIPVGNFVNFYHLAFVNGPSYSVITFNLFSARLFSSPPPSLARILARSSSSLRRFPPYRRGGAGTAPGGGEHRGAYKRHMQREAEHVHQAEYSRRRAPKDARRRVIAESPTEV